jgi:hypothetical protein
LSSDPGHFEIFRRGPKAWNAWREQNPTTIPQLAGIALKLSERQMGPANGGPINLKAARLQDAFLRFATLSAGNLEAADLSGADLVHARFDNADLSAANLSNAKLDHADFSGANLRNVNFSGASLCDAKNLTPAQLEESIGSDSTILPLDLQGFVLWSARSQTNSSRERRELRPEEARQTNNDHEINFNGRPVWMAGTLLIGTALFLTGFVWWGMSDASHFTSGASKPSVIEPKLSLDTQGQKFQPSPHQEVSEKRLDPEHPSEMALPSSAIPEKPEPRPVPGTDTAAMVPQEPNVEPQASGAANLSGETFGPNEQARRALGDDSEPGNNKASEVPLVSAKPAIVAAPDLPTAADPSVPTSVMSAVVPYRHATHGTVPDTALDPPDTSALGAAPPSMEPDLAAEAAMPETSSASVTDAPIQSLGLGTPLAPSLSDAATPSTADVPLSDQKEAETGLPHDAAPIPIPVRKPITETSISKPEAEIVPKPRRESVAQPDPNRLARGLSLPRSRSRVCVPIIGRYAEGQCSY